MPEYTMVEALNEALRRELSSNDRVIVLGEDIGRLGGVFRVTDRLQEEFGEQRVFDTPLGESAIAGLSIGLAMYGYRPVAEIQFDSFVLPAFNQIVAHAAKYRFRSRGKMPVPFVMRIPFGGDIGAAELHSESPETYFAHTAGLTVVVPSTPLDAFDLLTSSIRAADPVIFFEPKSRYWAKQEGELGDDPLPIGRARVVRDGDACTLISYGAMVSRCIQAAQAAEEDGVSVEVIDLRSLVPLDVKTLIESVAKTGRAIVVHEAPLTLGFGAEVSARIMEEAFETLQAPVLRVTGYDTPYPPAKVEKTYVPSLDRVLAAIDRSLNY